MIVLVRWTNHDRQYTIGLQKFLKCLQLEVTDEQIKNAIKELLEQQEMTQYEHTEYE